jgi:hypothetical protein
MGWLLVECIAERFGREVPQRRGDAEIRDQRSEIRDQRSEIRDQRIK